MVWKRALLGSAAVLAAAFLLASSASAGLREAKKEGEVFWYSSLTLKISQEICNLFNSKKVGVKCKLHRSGSSKLYKRYRREARGKIFKADVLHTSNIGQFIIMHDKLKFISKYKAKGTGKFLSKFRDPDNRWFILRASVMVPVYNPKFVKPEDVPKSYLDVLKPKWKNKLVVADPNYGGFATITMIALVNLYGLDYYEKLIKNNPRRYGSAAGTLTLVARGESHLTTGAVAYSAFNHIKKGEPLKMAVPKEGVPFVRSPTSVLKKAPHPAAARYFMDFLASQEVQQVLANRGLYVGHPGVKYPAAQTALSSLKLIEIPPAEISKRSKAMRKAFRKIFSGIKLEGKKKKKKKKKKQI
ncbi:MAG: extracellular solute-binding protein [bacterium]